jgi:hypothetical protein
MPLRNEVYDKLQKLCKNDRFEYFFEHAASPEIPEVASEILDELTDMVATQFSIDWHDRDIIRYFLRLGYFAHE